MVKDYYKVLDIPRDADADAIKQAYRDLVKQYHPDRTATLGPELQELAHKKMMEINEAFEVLSHPERRLDYDGELTREEPLSAEAQAAPTAGPTAAPPPPRRAGAKSDFWREIERIEAERQAADEAAAVRAAEAQAAQAQAGPEKAKAKPESKTQAGRNVLLDYIDKFYKGVMQSGGKWTVDAPKGWTWVLECGDWRKNYFVGYCPVDNLGTIGLKRILSRIQALMEKKKGVLKQSHFFVLVSYDRLMDTSQVIEGCKSWAAEGRPEGQRLLALVDTGTLSAQFFGVPLDDRGRTFARLLTPPK